MRKSLLLFIFLLAAIVLMKVNEAVEEKQLQKTTVEELMSDSGNETIAIN